MTCTDGTESATASTKECLEVVRIVMVIFLFWSFSETLLGCCSAWCNFSPNLLAAPVTEWLQRNLHLSCVRLWAFYLCVRVGGRSLFPELMFRSTHSGVRQVEWIKKNIIVEWDLARNGNVVHLRLPEIHISLGQIYNKAQGLQKQIPAAAY